MPSSAEWKAAFSDIDYEVAVEALHAEAGHISDIAYSVGDDSPAGQRLTRLSLTLRVLANSLRLEDTDAVDAVLDNLKSISAEMVSGNWDLDSRALRDLLVKLSSETVANRCEEGLAARGLLLQQVA